MPEALERIKERVRDLTAIAHGGAATLTEAHRRALARAWRELGDTVPIDELGSIHQELLEHRPVLDGGDLRLVRAPGHDRKLHGAYYTPPALVARVLDETLEPLLDRDGPGSIRVLDPACGDGAFLVAAAERITRRRIALGQAEGDARAAASGQVAGVDLDEAACELARLRLRRYGGPGAAIRVVHGDALLGAPPHVTDAAAAADLIPDGAAHPLHWGIAFHDVFDGRGGFDVIVGNPPWERMKLIEREWFARVSPEIAAAPTAAGRRRLIEQLATSNPELAEAWRRARRLAADRMDFARTSGRFPLCGTGDLNTFALFAELARELRSPAGRAGLIVQTDIALGFTYRRFFAELVSRGELVCLHDFINADGLFPHVDRRNPRFCILVMDSPDEGRRPRFSFWNRHPDGIDTPGRAVTITRHTLRRLRPETGTAPLVRNTAELALLEKIHRRGPLIDAERQHDPWHLELTTLFHMTNDSALFVTDPGPDTLPLYEAKMIHQYEHRHGDHALRAPCSRGSRWPSPPPEVLADPRAVVTPRFHVDRRTVAGRLGGEVPSWWWVARAITNPGNATSLITTIIPTAAVGNSLLIARFRGEGAARRAALLCALANSHVIDFAARSGLPGSNLNMFMVRQLPIPEPSSLDVEAPWTGGATVADWLVGRVIELVCVTDDLTGFGAEALGGDGSRMPFAHDAATRTRRRAEIDAAVSLLYGLDDADVDTMLAPAEASRSAARHEAAAALRHARHELVSGARRRSR